MNQTTETKRETTYFVNGERETTTDAELSVRRILENAGFTPATDYTLKSEDPKIDFDSEYDREVPIHHDQRFRAHHKGPTPTS
jgi:phenylalanyl-tRNA synthetase beta subunit